MEGYEVDILGGDKADGLRGEVDIPGGDEFDILEGHEVYIL